MEQNPLRHPAAAIQKAFTPWISGDITAVNLCSVHIRACLSRWILGTSLQAEMQQFPVPIPDKQLLMKSFLDFCQGENNSLLEHFSLYGCKLLCIICLAKSCERAGVGEYDQNSAYVERRDMRICFVLNPNVLYYPTGEDGAMEIPLRLSAEVERSILTAADSMPWAYECIDHEATNSPEQFCFPL